MTKLDRAKFGRCIAPVVAHQPVHEESVMALGASAEIAVIYAVVAIDEFEGAYRFYVGTVATPSYVYCSGRSHLYRQA